jgi:type III secretion protein V
MDVRRHVRALLLRNDLDLAVLSYQELAPEFSVQALATITGELAAGDMEKTQTMLEAAVD